MNEVHRYKVVKMLSEVGNRISYDPHGPEVVMASAYDDAQSQLAALREELADITDQCIDHVNLYKAWTKERDDLQPRLADAERRNAELKSVLERMLEDDDMPVHWFAQRIDAALNPNPEAASHDE